MSTAISASGGKIVKYNATTAWERLFLQPGASEAIDPLTGAPMFVCASLSLRGSAAFDFLKKFYGTELTRKMRGRGLDGKLCIRGIGRCLPEFREAQTLVARSYQKVGR